MKELAQMWGHKVPHIQNKTKEELKMKISDGVKLGIGFTVGIALVGTISEVLSRALKEKKTESTEEGES